MRLRTALAPVALALALPLLGSPAHAAPTQTPSPTPASTATPGRTATPRATATTTTTTPTPTPTASTGLPKVICSTWRGPVESTNSIICNITDAQGVRDNADSWLTLYEMRADGRLLNVPGATTTSSPDGYRVTFAALAGRRYVAVAVSHNVRSETAEITVEATTDPALRCRPVDHTPRATAVVGCDVFGTGARDPRPFSVRDEAGRVLGQGTSTPQGQVLVEFPTEGLSAAPALSISAADTPPTPIEMRRLGPEGWAARVTCQPIVAGADRPAVLSCRVTDAAGAGIGGVPVRAVGGFHTRRPTVEDVGEVGFVPRTTDPAGSVQVPFRTPILPAGDYPIWVSAGSGTRIAQGLAPARSTSDLSPLGQATRADGDGAPLTNEICTPTHCRQDLEQATNVVVGTRFHRLSAVVRDQWYAAGGATGRLGLPTETRHCYGEPCTQRFEGGSIAQRFSPNRAVAVVGAIHTHWQELAAEKGTLGQPEAGERCGLKDAGCYQDFTGGHVYWSPATGAHFVRGAIFSRWGAQGWEWGPVGYPTTGEFCGLPGGGCGQHFEHGSIYWHHEARVVEGALRDRWASLGWERGFLAYPRGEKFCGLKDLGCGQHFEGGSLYTSPSTGTRFVRGAIHDAWARADWERGPLGLPTSDEFCGLRDGGCAQRFQGGLAYWSPGSGAARVFGAIGEAYAQQRWEMGFLGYPLGNERCHLVDAGCVQRFQGGTIWWSPSTGAQVVRGAILEKYLSQGGEAGSLCYPREWERCDANGCSQTFDYGRIVWNPRDGARITRR
ncbi:hypothetical protein GCM10027418_01050 [Mariniluteicoccus endophyticus]